MKELGQGALVKPVEVANQELELGMDEASPAPSQ